MIHVNNSEQLQKWLLESGHLGRLWDRPRFYFDPVAFEQELQIVSTQYPRFSAEEAEARAALRLLGKEEAEGRRLVPPQRDRITRREKWLIAAIVLILVLLCLALRAKAADGPEGGEGFHSELGRARHFDGWASPQGQPSGTIIQVANQGTILATRPAGLLQFNCSTGMSCSFSGTTFTLTSTGGGGGSPLWSSILAPTGNLTINHATFTTTFTWGATTGAGVNLFNLTDSANNTGTGALLNLSTASGSALLPFQATALGTANGVQIDTTGLLKVIGAGGINATRYKGGNASGTGSCGANNWVNVLNDAAAPGCAQPGFSNLSGSIALGQTPLTTRGDVLTVNSTPALARLALGGNNLYLKSNGSDLVYSTLGAGGVGSCTNQAVTALNADAAPSCSSITGSFFANQNANLVFGGPSSGGAAPPSFRALVKADQVSTTVYTNQANTYTAGDQSFASAASLEVPTSGGVAPTANGAVAFDSAQVTPVRAYAATTDLGSGTLSVSRPLSALTNTVATDQDFATIYTIPANMLIAGRQLRITLLIQSVAGANNALQSYYLKLGTTKVFTETGAVTVANTTFNWTVTFNVWGTAAAGASVAVETSMAYTGPIGNVNGFNKTVQPVNLATNGTLAITPGLAFGATGGTDTVTLRTATVEVLH